MEKGGQQMKEELEALLKKLKTIEELQKEKMDSNRYYHNVILKKLVDSEKN